MNGSKIKTVLWDGEDITVAFQNGKWTAPEIWQDVVLTVIYEKVGSTPQTGDPTSVKALLLTMVLSTIGVLCCLPRKKKI